MKLKKVLSVFVAVAMITCGAVGVAFASNGWWVGPYGGVSFGTSQNVQVSAPLVNATVYNTKIRTGFTTGLSCGYDFTNPAYPDWAKYFGVQMDVGYTQSNFSTDRKSVV